MPFPEKLPNFWMEQGTALDRRLLSHLEEESIGGERVGGGLDGLVGRLVPQGGRVEASHPRRV